MKEAPICWRLPGEFVCQIDMILYQNSVWRTDTAVNWTQLLLMEKHSCCCVCSNEVFDKMAIYANVHIRCIFLCVFVCVAWWNTQRLIADIDRILLQDGHVLYILSWSIRLTTHTTVYFFIPNISPRKEHQISELNYAANFHFAVSNNLNIAI